jgi:hypothetical protein
MTLTGLRRLALIAVVLLTAAASTSEACWWCGGGYAAYRPVSGRRYWASYAPVYYGGVSSYYSGGGCSSCGSGGCSSCGYDGCGYGGCNSCGTGYAGCGSCGSACGTCGSACSSGYAPVGDEPQPETGGTTIPRSVPEDEFQGVKPSTPDADSPAPPFNFEAPAPGEPGGNPPSAELPLVPGVTAIRPLPTGAPQVTSLGASRQRLAADAGDQSPRLVRASVGVNQGWSAIDVASNLARR